MFNYIYIIFVIIYKFILGMSKNHINNISKIRVEYVENIGIIKLYIYILLLLF